MEQNPKLEHSMGEGNAMRSFLRIVSSQKVRAVAPSVAGLLVIGALLSASLAVRAAEGGSPKPSAPDAAADGGWRAEILAVELQQSSAPVFFDAGNPSQPAVAKEAATPELPSLGCELQKDVSPLWQTALLCVVFGFGLIRRLRALG